MIHALGERLFSPLNTSVTEGTLLLIVIRESFIMTENQMFHSHSYLENVLPLRSSIQNRNSFRNK